MSSPNWFGSLDINYIHHFCQATGFTNSTTRSNSKCRGWSWSTVAYLEYIKENLQVTGGQAFNEDVLMLVLEDSDYSHWISIQIEIIHLDQIIDLITTEEIDALSHKWQRGQVATVLANRSAVLKSMGASNFDLDKVHGIVKTTRTIKVPPFQTAHIHSLLCIKEHEKGFMSWHMPLKNITQSPLLLS